MRGIFHYCLKIAKLQTLQNISIMNGEKYCKYYKITDITKHSNIYVLVCQSNLEKELQNYKPYKYLYNQHMKKQKITTLQTLQKIHGQKIVCVVFSTIA